MLRFHGSVVFATEATRVTEEMFIVAAKAVAEQVTDEDLDRTDLPSTEPDFGRVAPCAGASRRLHLRSRARPGAKAG